MKMKQHKIRGYIMDKAKNLYTKYKIDEFIPLAFTKSWLARFKYRYNFRRLVVHK